MTQVVVPVVTKRCYKCNTAKSALAFGICRIRKAKVRTHDGLQDKCRKCINQYYQDNREEKKQKARAIYHRAPELQRQQDRVRYARNPLPKRAQANQWRLDHPEERKNQEAERRSLCSLSKQSRRKSILHRKRIKNNPCFYCGKPANTDDHFYPLSRGGTDHWWNLVRACGSCNSSKSDRLGSEFVKSRLPRA